MTRPDTPPTPAPAQDVTARAAEVLCGELLPPARPCAFHAGKAVALADAGLLARDLLTRDEIVSVLVGMQSDEHAEFVADAVLALLRGESRG